MEKKITLNHITKIEGHASLNLGIKDGKVTVCELGSTEGARYFEGLVLGRKYYEAHEMTSRICGICSSAHVIAAVSAIENAIGFTPSEQTLKLRALLTLGERIRSHATHLYFLALPDYLGYESAIAMAPKYKKELKMALKMVKVGNHMVSLFGGRDLHPVSECVGGWLKVPKQEELDELIKMLQRIKADTIKTCKLFFSFKIPNLKGGGLWFSISEPDRYVILQGRFCSGNKCYDPAIYNNFLREYHNDYSTANFVVKDEKRYLLGALARLNNNYKFLSKDAKRMLDKSKLKLPTTNPFANNLAQAIELVHAIDHSIEICKNTKINPKDIVKEFPAPRAGVGVGAIEAPRGTLFHEYELDNEGKIIRANIITPTAQNLLNMQEDIRNFVPSIVNKSRDKIILEIEKLIRSCDPCFSCSSHFLDVKWVE